VAEQIDAAPAAIEEYLAAGRNRQGHAVEMPGAASAAPVPRRNSTTPFTRKPSRTIAPCEPVVEECRRRAGDHRREPRRPTGSKSARG